MLGFCMGFPLQWSHKKITWPDFFFKVCHTCPIPQQICINYIYTKYKISWIMPDEAKSWIFLTQIDHVMHKLRLQFLRLRYANQNRLMDICSGQVLCQVSWLIKKTFSWILGRYIFICIDGHCVDKIYMDIMKLMPITTRQDLVADGFLHQTAIAKSLAFL